MDWRAALLSRFSGLAGGRFYWVERPQGGPLPAGVLVMVSDARDQHLKGFEGMQASRVQIDCYGAKAKEAWDLAEAVIAAVVPAAVTNGHGFSRAMVDLPPRDLTERAADKTVFRVSMDLIFNHAINEGGS